MLVAIAWVGLHCHDNANQLDQAGGHLPSAVLRVLVADLYISLLGASTPQVVSSLLNMKYHDHRS
jgi:hypothetical protein